MFLILPQLNILCASAVKRYYASNGNSPYTCHLFPVQWSSWKLEKLATNSSDLNLVNSPLYRALQ